MKPYGVMKGSYHPSEIIEEERAEEQLDFGHRTLVQPRRHLVPIDRRIRVSNRIRGGIRFDTGHSATIV